MTIWILLVLFFMQNNVMRLVSRGRIGSLGGRSLMREVLPRVGLRFKKNLHSRKGFPTMFPKAL